jgi:lambda repressor-like predicted transcriptional regulator
MPTKTAQIVREWARWLNIKGMPVEDIAGMLAVPPAKVLELLADRQNKADDEVWPFNRLTPANVRKRKILAWTATYCRRLAAIDYKPARIAELLRLDEEAVSSFIRRIRRIRSPRRDRHGSADRLRPRTAAEERAHLLAVKRASHRRRQREEKTLPPEWSYRARSETSRSEVAALAQLQTAVREGRLATGELFDLFSRAYHAPPRGPALPLPEPAIWTGPETYSYGAAKLDEDQAAEIRELRRQGWSTGKLARRYSLTRSTICNVLLGRTHYLPPRPARPLIIPAAEKPRADSQAAEPVIWTGAASVQDPTRQPAAKLTYENVDEARALRAQGWHVIDLATKYGVSASTMNAALTGRTWKPHCPPPLVGGIAETKETMQKTGVSGSEEGV